MAVSPSSKKLVLLVIEFAYECDESWPAELNRELALPI